MILKLVDSKAITGSARRTVKAVILFGLLGLGLEGSLWTLLWSQLACRAVVTHWAVIHGIQANSNGAILASNAIQTVVCGRGSLIGVLSFSTGRWQLGSFLAIEATGANIGCIIWNGGS